MMKAYNSSKFLLFLAVCLVASVFSQAVFAEVITANRVFTTQAAGNKIYYGDLHINVSDGVMTNNWRTTQPNGSNSDYFNGYPVSFVIDLGADCDLESFNFYGIDNKNTVSNLTLNFATSAQGVLGFSGTGETFSLNNTTALQTKALSESQTARYVQVVINDNFYDTGGGGGDRVGMADIHFNGTKGAAAPAAIAPTIDAQYDFLIQPVGVREMNNHSSDSDFSDSAMPLSRLIDGTTDTPTADGWRTNGVSGDGPKMVNGTLAGDYFSFGASPIIRFDLGEEYTLDGLSLWGYGGTPNSNVLREFSLNFYDSSGDLLDVGFNFLLEDTIMQNESVDFSFDKVSDIQYVDMIMLDNFFGVSGEYGDRIALSGVRFHGLEAQSSATPEPATWVMMVLGLLGGAVAYRRRRK